MVTSCDQFEVFILPKMSLEWLKLDTSNFVHWLAIWNTSLWIDKLSLKLGLLWPCVLFKFWEIINNLSEIVQDRHSYNGKLIENYVWPIKGKVANDLEWGWWSLLLFKTSFNTHNSGNIVCFNYSVFTHKLECAPGLWFKCYCQRWRTS